MVCARFIRDVLPDERDDHRREFVERVQRLAGDLTAAFLDAAHAIVGYGVNWNSEMIAEGALQDLDGFEAVAESAIAVWEATYDPAIELAALNGEYSDDALERIWEDRAEDGHTAGELLDAYVLKLRDTRGWQARRRAGPTLDRGPDQGRRGAVGRRGAGFSIGGQSSRAGRSLLVVRQQPLARRALASAAGRPRRPPGRP